MITSYTTIDEYVAQNDDTAPIHVPWARPVDVQFISFITSIIDDPLEEHETLRHRRNEQLRLTKNELNLMEEHDRHAHRLERAEKGTDRRTSSGFRLYPTSEIERFMNGSEHTYALATYLLATNSKTHPRAHSAERLLPQRPFFELEAIARYANERFIEAIGTQTHRDVTGRTEQALFEALATGSIEEARIPTLDRTLLEPTR